MPGPQALRRSSHDREILGLALPALGTLAAEPLYVLVDTAIVGHLGTAQLAALALAATVLGGFVGLCNFLAYATTAQVARLAGAGERARADELAPQALWLALGVGIVGAGALAALAHPLMTLVGGHGHPAALAARYLRLSAPGLPSALLALAGQGFLRGVGDLRSPLIVVGIANAANVVLELVLVYVARLGLDGSALGTVLAQSGMGAAFAWLLLVAGGRRSAPRRPHFAVLRRLARMGGDIVVRTASLIAAFTLASAVLARVGAASLAANEIAFQLFLFLALALDAIAIAGQVIVARTLGAGDAAGAYAAAARMNVWALAVGLVFGAALLAGTDVIPRAFTSDARVLGHAHALWPWFAAMQPVGAVVFALDGILIGAGDSRYLAVAMAGSLVCFAPLCLAAHGVSAVWIALNVLMLTRLAATGLRFRGRRWMVLGAA